jgi:hypothetical protein
MRSTVELPGRDRESTRCRFGVRARLHRAGDSSARHRKKGRHDPLVLDDFVGTGLDQHQVGGVDHEVGLLFEFHRGVFGRLVVDLDFPARCSPLAVDE